MAKFYFHVRRGGGELIPDSEGLDLPLLDSAVDECASLVREVLKDAAAGELLRDGQFEITDEEGRVLVVIPFFDETLD